MGIFKEYFERRKEKSKKTAIENGKATILGFKDEIQENARVILRIVTLSSSAATSILFGFFVSIGLQFFNLIDKTSMLGSLFFYGVILSVLYTPISILTTCVSAGRGSNNTQSDNESSDKIPIKLLLPIAFVLLVFSWVMLGYIYSAIFLTASTIIYLGTKIFKTGWATSLTWVVLLALFFGFFRGEYLKQQAYQTQITLKENKTNLPATVVMTAQSGILAFSGKPRQTVLIPWSSIESVKSLNNNAAPGFVSLWQKRFASFEQDIDNTVRGWIRD